MRRVVKNVPKVAVTPGTGDFGPGHTIRTVGSKLYTIASLGSVEGRPAASRIEFGLGIEQLLPASGTVVRSYCKVIIVFVGEGALRAFVAEHAVLV